MARERDMRNAAAAALEATGQFESVHLSGLPENWGFGASEAAAAVVEPFSETDQDLFDGGANTGGIRTDRIKITLIVRNPDPQLRDEAVEDLLEFARNALNGQPLVPGFNFPDKTKIGGNLRWLPATPPERRLEAILSYDYLYTGWASNDTTP